MAQDDEVGLREVFEAWDVSCAIVALLLVALAVLLPLRPYIGHHREAADLQERVPTLEEIGRSSFERSWSPVPDAWNTLTVLRIRADAGAGPEQLHETIELALMAEGFERGSGYNLRRANGETSEGLPRSDIATIEVLDDGEAAVHYTRWRPTRDAVPYWLYLSTLLLALAAVVCRAGGESPTWFRRLRPALAGVTLGLVTLQAVLLVRALWMADALLDNYQAEHGEIIDMMALRSDRALGITAFEVANVTRPLYPFGVGTLWFLALPWAVGVATAATGPCWRVGLLGLGLVVIVVASALFGETSGHVLDILE